ncbi:MAG: SDR family oxidoreductase [Rhodocyclales bacterium]|nr:SDR family oxidoreductase [Rhodocyclales bacterium]
MPVTVITGSASGIGAAIRTALTAAGYTIIGIDRHDADIVADLSHPAGRKAAVDAALAACGGSLDGLVCSAGLGPHCQSDDIVAVNYFGATALLDGLFPALQRGTQPAAVAIASVASVQMDFDGHPLRAAFLDGNEDEAKRLCRAAGDQAAAGLAYAASKHALVCDVRRRTYSWGGAGVRINAVAPGPIETPLLRDTCEDPRYHATIRDFVPPIGRVGRADEVAALTQFLLSPAAGFIHASVFFIDGGIGALMHPTRF